MLILQILLKFHDPSFLKLLLLLILILVDCVLLSQFLVIFFSCVAPFLWPVGPSLLLLSRKFKLYVYTYLYYCVHLCEYALYT